jgi:hypothetical protein
MMMTGAGQIVIALTPLPASIASAEILVTVDLTLIVQSEITSHCVLARMGLMEIRRLLAIQVST